MSDKSLWKNTVTLSFGILINKPIGFLRDILQMKYFGLSLLGDAYVIAWRIPNVLRRIFSEGLMTSVLLPYLVKIKAEESEKTLNEVITAISIVMQIIVSIACFFVALYSRNIILLLSPGSLERVVFGADMLQILIFFTFFTSLSSVLGVAVQLYKTFYIGPLSQFFLNIFFCIELFFSIKYQLSYTMLCLMITLNSFLVIAVHAVAFYRNNFYFVLPTKKSFFLTINFFKRFFVAFFSSLLLEVNMFAGLSFSSYLAPGLLSLFEYINTLIRLPLQIFGSALATTSQGDIGSLVYQKSYDVLEKKVFRMFLFFFILSFFITIGIFIFGRLFFAFFFSIVGVSAEYISLATQLLSLFSLLIFPALANKILLNIFYSFHSVALPTFINFLLSLISNYILWSYVKIYGIHAVVVSSVLIEYSRFLIFSVLLSVFYDIVIFRKNRIFKK
jgi:putative peptidoglycan lipid II flippase